MTPNAAPATNQGTATRRGLAATTPTARTRAAIPPGFAAIAAPRSRLRHARTLVVIPHIGHGTPVDARSGHRSPGWIGDHAKRAPAVSMRAARRRTTRPSRTSDLFHNGMRTDRAAVVEDARGEAVNWAPGMRGC